MARNDQYQAITDRVIEALQAGTAPWLKPWKASPLGNVPHNPVSGTRYRGINVILTLMTQWERGYDHPVWLTFKQANQVAAKAARKAGHKVEKNKRGSFVFADGENKGKSVGGVRKGQSAKNGQGGTTVVFWKVGQKTFQNEEGEDESRSFMMMRTYTVFNVAQCDQAVQDYLLGTPEEAPEFEPLEAAERIVEGFEIDTRHGGDRAFYSLTGDYIQLPNRETFKSPSHYYTTRFHEMGHATGHASRLARKGIANLGRDRHDYAEEELVAEFTACFLAGEAGILRTVENNSAAYLRNWAAKLRDDKRMIVRAAQQAQKAADLILGRASAGKANADEEAAEAA